MIDLPRKNSRLQSGFSFIEILVSMIIIGVGLLGLGGLQVASIKGAGNAHSRIVANMLAMELADRMRANPRKEKLNDPLYYETGVDCTDNVTNCRINTSCTRQEVAMFDVQEIMCGMKRAGRREGGVANLLSNGTLEVTAQPGSCTMANRVYTNSEYQIEITWSDRNVHKEQQESAQEQTLTLCLVP